MLKRQWPLVKYNENEEYLCLERYKVPEMMTIFNYPHMITFGKHIFHVLISFECET